MSLKYPHIFLLIYYVQAVISASAKNNTNLIDKIGNEASYNHDLFSLTNNGDEILPLDVDFEYPDEGLDAKIRDKKHDEPRRGPKLWDQWGRWSTCSVTCGVGKIVRWRHCVSGGCAPGEKEAQIKTCTLPPC